MTEVRSIRVMIVDDHDLVRRGIKAALLNCPDIEVVAESNNGRDALQLCAEYTPDIILMDLHMPGMDGLSTTRGIRAQNQHVQIVALTGYDDEKLVRGVLEAGALSYLLKNVSVHDLADAIRKAYVKKSTLAKEATQALVNAVVRPASPVSDLTRREREVLKQMALGASNMEIADKLTVSVSTVKKHVSNILDKLNVRTRTEAVALAFKRNLLDTAQS